MIKSRIDKMGGVLMVVGGMVRKEEENFESSARFEHRGTTPLKNSRISPWRNLTNGNCIATHSHSQTVRKCHLSALYLARPHK